MAAVVVVVVAVAVVEEGHGEPRGPASDRPTGRHGSENAQKWAPNGLFAHWPVSCGSPTIDTRAFTNRYRRPFDKKKEKKNALALVGRRHLNY